MTFSSYKPMECAPKCQTWAVFRNSTTKVAEVTLARGGAYTVARAPNRRLTLDDMRGIDAIMWLNHKHAHLKAGICQLI